MVVLPHPIAVHGSLNGLGTSCKSAEWLSAVIDADEDRKSRNDHFLSKKSLSPQRSFASSNISLTNTYSSSSSLSVFRVSRNSAFSPVVAVVQKQQDGDSADYMVVDEKFCSSEKFSSLMNVDRKTKVFDESIKILPKTTAMNESKRSMDTSLEPNKNRSTIVYENTSNHPSGHDLLERSVLSNISEVDKMLKLQRPNSLMAPRLLQENVRICNDNNRRVHLPRGSNHLNLSNVLLPLKYDEIFPLISDDSREEIQQRTLINDRKRFDSIELRPLDGSGNSWKNASTLPMPKNKKKLENWPRKDSHFSSMRDVIQRIREMERVLKSWSLQ